MSKPIHAHAVIVPSRAAEQQLKAVLPHLPSTQVIEPVIPQWDSSLKAGEGHELIVLIPGNLAINKGYLELKSIISQSNDLGLTLRFHILGRVDAWIERELSSITNVKLLGTYNTQNFASKASGADLALFLSPWPETYCITFDEWKQSGRPCFYYKIGALDEKHRQEGLHQASAGFSPNDCNGIIKALIKATTPDELQRIREQNKIIKTSPQEINFGLQHWSLFREMLYRTREYRQIHWTKRTQQLWVNEQEGHPKMTTRQRLKRFVYQLPEGHKFAAQWRRMRGR